MDLVAAKKAARNGAIAGFVSTGLAFVVVSVAVSIESTDILETWNDPLNFLDVVFMGGLAFGMLRHSRVAAIFMFFYFVASKLLVMAETGTLYGIPVTLMFLYFFGRAILGTFAYHRIRREQDPDYKPVRKAMYFVWVPVVVIGMIFAGLMVIDTFTPPTSVIAGDEVSQSDVDILRAEGIIAEDEKLILFFSAGMFSVREDGNIITDKRVISYEEVDDELWIGSARFDQIHDLSIIEEGDLITDAQLLVTLHDGSQFDLLISIEDDGVNRFMGELTRRMK